MSAPRLRRRRIAFSTLALLLAAGGLASLLDGASLGSASGAGAFAPGPTYASVGLSLNLNQTGANLSGPFYGVDASVYYPLGSTPTGVVSGSPIRYIRWPSGQLIDSLNESANFVHHDGGTGYFPPTSERDFVAWCKSVDCHAILGVSGEINSPSTAAYEVAYTERTLGFHPDYWEIGNEPALWQHFGYPWSQWTSTQHTNATPMSYAKLVHSYIPAMRSVDPNIRIVGLPGLGSGSFGEDSWVRATVALNGPDLAAVALHIYPAGHSGLDGSLASFYSSLGGSGGLPARIPAARQAILAACPSCTKIRVIVTEFGAATVPGGSYGGNYGAYMSGFPEVPYVAAELAQAMNLNVTNLDLYSLESIYDGALVNGTTGTPRPIAHLYTDLLPHLDPIVVSSRVTGADGGLYVAATRNANASSTALLVANANASTGASIALSGSGFLRGGAGEAWTWNASGARPAAVSWSGAAPAAWTLPPSSVAVLLGSRASTGPGGNGTGGGNGGGNNTGNGTGNNTGGNTTQGGGGGNESGNQSGGNQTGHNGTTGGPPPPPSHNASSNRSGAPSPGTPRSGSPSGPGGSASGGGSGGSTDLLTAFRSGYAAARPELPPVGLLGAAVVVGAVGWTGGPRNGGPRGRVRRPPSRKGDMWYG